MKVYFTASITGKQYYLANYQKIVQLIEQRGNEVIAEHILDHSESQIRLETKEERLLFQSKLGKWICGCDCMVVEATFPSISVGYEISLALQQGKPVLILYCEGDPPALLSNTNDEKLVCEPYTHERLQEIIDGFLDYVKGKVDSRFTFYVTAAQMTHLLKKSKEKRIPKAAYLRELIDRDM